MLDTSEYTVEMSDILSQELTNNIIDESMSAQVDSKGHHYQLLQEITEHIKDGLEIPISYGVIRSHNGNIVPKKTTQVWDLLMEWKDGSSIWIPFEYLRASNTVELAEYEAGNRLYV